MYLGYGAKHTQLNWLACTFLITVFDDQTNNSRHLGIVSEAMTLGLHMLRSCPFQSSALLISLALHKIKLRFPR